MWYLQRKGIFKGDSAFFLHQFQEISQNQKPDKATSTDLRVLSYRFGKFLTVFFSHLFEFSSTGSTTDLSFRDESFWTEIPELGRWWITDNQDNQWDGFYQDVFSDDCYYQSVISQDHAISYSKQIFPDDLPIFNMLEEFESIEGPLDDFLIGALFEQTLTVEMKKATGAYYTPENICSFLVEYLLVPDVLKVAEHFSSNISNFSGKPLLEILREILDQLSDEKILPFTKGLFIRLTNFHILDPAMGSGHFLAAITDLLIDIYKIIWETCQKHSFSNIFIIEKIGDTGEWQTIDLAKNTSFDNCISFLKCYIIFPKNIFGVDLNPNAVIMSRIRMGLNFAKTWNISNDFPFSFPALHVNLKTGNSLIGWSIWEELLQFIHHQGKIKKNVLQNLPSDAQIYNWLQNIINPSTNDLIDGIQEISDKNPQGISMILQIKSFFLTSHTCSPLNKLNFLHSLLVFLQNVTKYSSSALISQKVSLTLSLLQAGFNEFLTALFKLSNRKRLESISINPFHWIIEFPEIFPFFAPTNLLNYPISKSCVGFDLIIANPPYGNLLTSQEKMLCQSQSYASPLNEISAMFLERCFPLNQIQGNLLFITSYVITFSKDLSQTREKLMLNYSKCKISTFDRDRCRIFSGMSQSLSFLMCFSKNPPFLIPTKHQGKICTTGMYRTMPELYTLTFHSANDLLLGTKIGQSYNEKHRLPKIGDMQAVKILQKLAELTHNEESPFQIVGNIINSWKIVSSDSDYTRKIGPTLMAELPGFWIRISGNYWYNGFDRSPYYGTQIAYVPLQLIEPTPKDFLILLVNSSLFYLWSRIYGDGRHLNADILKAFPLPSTFQIKLQIYGPLLTMLKTTLMKALFSTFDSKHNRFATSRIKFVLDVVDMFLGSLYGLSSNLIAYIQGFESEIRGGKQIPAALETSLSKFIHTLEPRVLHPSTVVKFQRILDDLEEFLVSTAIT
jgi:hypothetical protein